MLKIKDNVDLKELEKFGFKYDEELEIWYKHCIGTLTGNTREIEDIKREWKKLDEEENHYLY